MASKKILVQEDFVHVSSGSNPAAGFLAFYPKSDNNFYLRTSAGVERRLLTSDDSFWTASGNNIYNANAGNVGIGTNNPLWNLDLNNGILARFNSSWTGLSNNVIIPTQNFLAYATKNPYFTISVSANPTNGISALANLFDDSSETDARWNSSQFPVVIEINWADRKNTNGLYGVGFYGTSYAANTVKIEAYDDYNSSWVTIIDTIANPNDSLSVYKYKNYVTRVRYTISDSAKSSIRIVKLLFANSSDRRGYYLRKGGDELYGQLSSLVPTGTAPFVIASTTVNTNLNADLLDGYHASSFALSSHTHAYLPLSGGEMYNTSLVTNLNADLLDGLHYSAFAPASHNHSFAGLSDVALVSPSAGQMLLYNGSNWVNTDHITSSPGNEYNTIQIKSKEIVDDFGNAEFYMSAEEGIFFRTNISKPDFAEVTFNKFGISSSKLAGTGERYLSADASGHIMVATVQPTQYWQRDSGNFNLSPINPADEVNAWSFRTGGLIMADGYLEYGKSGIYTLYNDMVVSEFYLTNNTFYYANSKLAFNNSTNLLTVDGGINAGSNLIAAGEVKLTKQTPGGVLRLQSYASGPDFLRQQDYAGAVTFEAYNGSGYSGVATISARASQNHSGSGMGTNIEFWNYPNNGSNTRPAMILREDGILDNYFGFAVSGSDGKSGTATILTGCSYNSVTKTLIYTRASVTFSGGIVTNIASMSSLSVPLT